ncbi:cell wall protein IFF6-like [Sander lucioperca]|uniref:cell wall protein IFF6-like n=1 Tax=Sander lucioperca TaxID=283035 RepID=UPI001653DF3C|nr:cell wall protein IFF6-like [Sander lucioperca]
MPNKDTFTRYFSVYPDFAEAVRFHRVFEEARVKSLQPGQEAQALVGFGDFKFETLQNLYESEDSKKIRFVNYLRRKAPAPGTQMENSVQYVRNRDRQARAAAASTTTAAASRSSSTTTSSSISSSQASVSAASQRARSASQPLGSALVAFVSGWRTLSAVEMQAKLKKIVPKPAFPASSFRPFRPALPSTSTEEPSDEELVKAVVDLEKSSTSYPLSSSSSTEGGWCLYCGRAHR